MHAIVECINLCRRLKPRNVQIKLNIYVSVIYTKLTSFSCFFIDTVQCKTIWFNFRFKETDITYNIKQNPSPIVQKAYIQSRNQVHLQKKSTQWGLVILSRPMIQQVGHTIIHTDTNTAWHILLATIPVQQATNFSTKFSFAGLFDNRVKLPHSTAVSWRRIAKSTVANTGFEPLLYLVILFILLIGCLLFIATNLIVPYSSAWVSDGDRVIQSRWSRCWWGERCSVMINT